MENNIALKAGVNSRHSDLMLVLPFSQNYTHTPAMNKINIELTVVSSAHLNAYGQGAASTLE